MIEFSSYTIAYFTLYCPNHRTERNTIKVIKCKWYKEAVIELSSYGTVRFTLLPKSSCKKDMIKVIKCKWYKKQLQNSDTLSHGRTPVTRYVPALSTCFYSNHCAEKKKCIEYSITCEWWEKAQTKMKVWHTIRKSILFPRPDSNHKGTLQSF